MNHLARYALIFATASLAVACSSTIDVGGNDGGSGDGGVSGDDGGSSTPLSDAATSSPNFERCKIACAAPADGPCASTDVNACIEKCTAFTEGLATSCAQCVVEHSNYAGTRCVPDPCDASCPDVVAHFPAGKSAICVPDSTCGTACTPSDEKCEGFDLAKTTDSACVGLCK